MTKMADVALSSAGSKVVLATSSDEKYPPENIIDGQPETFWTTTGMFPQEFIISFTNLVKIATVTVQSYNVQSLSIEKSVSTDPVNFEKCTEKHLEQSEGHIQTEEFALGGTSARYMRFIIKSGFDHFVSIHRVIVEGSTEYV
ncbi:intraflagellar transport protein 25 homolog [Latimeria chalumnae]|uniref:Intraflagellar transport protein 25 homolog n=1 Tax=Latimeria chalumnae TaxID=7897 RepID=H3AKA4_LATCH|nr:PREDICTED: intraflagellar transport protein 25 homolog [Latimeria chalumnae]|eukprot:XP_006002611.1 PREDICTED: intraflagellar transport protein 25 homolog [Latimeria chalumnae]